jgi:hypothetical protein
VSSTALSSGRCGLRAQVLSGASASLAAFQATSLTSAPPSTAVPPTATSVPSQPPAPTATSTPGSSGSGALHVQGNQLIGANGQSVQLHGADRSGTEYMCVTGANFADGPTTAASVQAMAGWHINAIRVPLNEDCWLGINGVVLGGNAYQQDTINWVNTITQNGMYAIVDLHWSAPGATQATGQEPMADTDHSSAFWTGVASAFKGNGNVIFDLYNEPHDVSWACVRDGCQVTAREGMSYQGVGMQQLVNTVRATGATNVIMVGGNQWAGMLDQWIQYKPSDPLNNVAASMHSYPFSACANSTCWNTYVAPVAQQYPIIMGEVGETDGGNTYLPVVVPWLNARGISYCAWTWNNDFNGESLVSDYNGTPTSYGQGYKTQLAGF